MTSEQGCERTVREPVESPDAFADDLLVEAARAGWLRDDPAADPLARLLARIHTCASGACACGARDGCTARTDPRRR